MLRPGDTVPAFALPDQHGVVRSRDALLAEGDLILYFYPADFTPVCTREACTFRDRFADLAGVGARVVGVSPQDVASHARFAAEHALPFPLLADVDRALIRAVGVDGPLGVGVRRATFLVGTDGRVRARALADFFLGDHRALIERVLDDAARGEN